MRKQGNSLIEVCVNNLMQIKKGEVCFERLMGLGSFIDQPINQAKGMLEVEIEEQIETYEPRAEIDTTEIADAIDENGNINVSLIIKGRRET